MPARKVYDDEAILGFVRRGWSDHRIADHLGCWHTRVGQIRRNAGLAANNPRRRWTAAEDAKLKAVLARAGSYKATARSLGRSVSECRHRVNRLGLGRQLARRNTTNTGRLLRLYETRIAKLVAAKFGPPVRRHVPLEELVQVGRVGFLDAIDRYRKRPGVTLWAYAAKRVWGSVKDHLRKVSPLSRSHVAELKATGRRVTIVPGAALLAAHDRGATATEGSAERVADFLASPPMAGVTAWEDRCLMIELYVHGRTRAEVAARLGRSAQWVSGRHQVLLRVARSRCG